MIDVEAGSAAGSGLDDMAALKAAAEAVEAAETPKAQTADVEASRDETSNVETKAEKPEAQKDVPPHRSHDPTNNLKRSDPFQFGSRYLEAGDDVFEFNAWDHVETDDAYKLYAEGQLEKQRQSPVSDFDKSRFFSPRLPFFFCFPTGLCDDTQSKCIVHLSNLMKNLTFNSFAPI